MTPRYEKHPSYSALADRYGNDIVAFATEVLQLEVSPKMAMLLRSATKPGARMTVTYDLDTLGSCPVTPLAPAGVWRLFFKPDSYTAVACPRHLINVADGYRMLVMRAMERLDWIAPYIRIGTDYVLLGRLGEGACIQFAPARATPPERIDTGWSQDTAWIMEDAHLTHAVCFSAAGAALKGSNGPWLISAQTGWSIDRGDVPGATWHNWDEFAVDGPALKQTAPRGE